jgi:hypothetical protein
VLIIGEADRFQCGKQVASYLGLKLLDTADIVREAILRQ